MINYTEGVNNELSDSLSIIDKKIATEVSEFPIIPQSDRISTKSGISNDNSDSSIAHTPRANDTNESDTDHSLKSDKDSNLSQNENESNTATKLESASNIKTGDGVLPRAQTFGIESEKIQMIPQDTTRVSNESHTMGGNNFNGADSSEINGINENTGSEVLINKGGLASNEYDSDYSSSDSSYSNSSLNTETNMQLLRKSPFSTRNGSDTSENSSVSGPSASYENISSKASSSVSGSDPWRDLNSASQSNELNGSLSSSRYNIQAKMEVKESNPEPEEAKSVVSYQKLQDLPTVTNIDQNTPQNKTPVSRKSNPSSFRSNNQVENNNGDTSRKVADEMEAKQVDQKSDVTNASEKRQKPGEGGKVMEKFNGFFTMLRSKITKNTGIISAIFWFLALACLYPALFSGWLKNEIEYQKKDIKGTSVTIIGLKSIERYDSAHLKDGALLTLSRNVTFEEIIDNTYSFPTLDRLSFCSRDEPKSDGSKPAGLLFHRPETGSPDKKELGEGRDPLDPTKVRLPFNPNNPLEKKEDKTNEPSQSAKNTESNEKHKDSKQGDKINKSEDDKSKDPKKDEKAKETKPEDRPKDLKQEHTAKDFKKDTKGKKSKQKDEGATAAHDGEGKKGEKEPKAASKEKEANEEKASSEPKNKKQSSPDDKENQTNGTDKDGLKTSDHKEKPADEQEEHLRLIQKFIEDEDRERLERLKSYNMRRNDEPKIAEVDKSLRIYRQCTHERDFIKKSCCFRDMCEVGNLNESDTMYFKKLYGATVYDVHFKEFQNLQSGGKFIMGLGTLSLAFLSLVLLMVLAKTGAIGPPKLRETALNVGVISWVASIFFSLLGFLVWNHYTGGSVCVDAFGRSRPCSLHHGSILFVTHIIFSGVGLLVTIVDAVLMRSKDVVSLGIV